MYQYAMVNRPFGLGTAPTSGFLQVLPRPGRGQPHHDMARHGVAVYERALTHEETKNFELAPMLSIEEQSIVVDLLIADMRDYAQAYARMAQRNPDQFTSHIRDRVKAVCPGYMVSLESFDALQDALAKRLNPNMDGHAQVADEGREDDPGDDSDGGAHFMADAA